MSAALDVVIRAWLVVAAWVRLHRAPALHRLANLLRPMAFVRAALVPAGRMVALAIALLPRKHRREAAIAYVACKALVAFDDADAAVATGRITAAVHYLTGESAELPRTACALGTTRANPLQSLLAARLPLLRAAFKGLPGDAARRCCAIVERIGDAMIHARVDERSESRGRGPAGFAGGEGVRPLSINRRCGADHVFGEAVFAAARLLVPSLRAPGFACSAAGRALRLVDDVRRAPRGAEHDRVLCQAVQALPTVPRLLRWIPASAEGGTRAAVALIAATTYRFYLRELGAEVPRRLRHPLRAALAAAWSRRAYCAAVDAIEDGLHDALDALAARDVEPAYSITAMQQPLEQYLPSSHPPSVVHVA